MFTLLQTKNIRYCISVYEGISPALLATMSLSQGIKGTNNDELISSLVKGSIIHNQILQNSMKEIDRKHFIPLNKNCDPYKNVPVKISDGQNMTDIFTHSVILQKVANHLESAKYQQLSVLDIGTGHGYLAFVIANILNKCLNNNKKLNSNNLEVVGIDAGENCIRFCNQLKNQIYKSDNMANLEFKQKTLQNLIEEENKKAFDIVIGGFYMPPKMESLLLQSAKTLEKDRKQNYLGIWAADSENGQSLYTHTFTKDGNLKKEQIMATLFSMPIVETSVSKYFIENPEEQNNEQSAQRIDEEQVKQKLMQTKRQRRKDEKQKLKEQLKVRIGKYSKSEGKLSLEKMRTIPEIRQILEQLQKYK